MRKNILVAKFNRTEIVFTDMQKTDKASGEKVALYHSVIKGEIFEGKVFYPVNVEFKESFDILYSQLGFFGRDFYETLRSSLAVKYHEGVL